MLSPASSWMMSLCAVSEACVKCRSTLMVLSTVGDRLSSLLRSVTMAGKRARSSTTAPRKALCAILSRNGQTARGIPRASTSIGSARIPEVHVACCSSNLPSLSLDDMVMRSSASSSRKVSPRSVVMVMVVLIFCSLGSYFASLRALTIWPQRCGRPTCLWIMSHCNASEKPLDLVT